MSAPIPEVSQIHDEEILRKMWQDTEDFGRKKEIRTHMYKLREARLKEFYNSGEVSHEIQRTETKSSNTHHTHVDSLLNDHSFQTMKSKEIRDSESPTKDMHHGWNIVSKNETSNDGKSFTTTNVATTSGTELIQGGKIDYAAKNEMKGYHHLEGDDKNFNKSVGASSSTLIQQEASGGDDNCKFSSTSNKSTTSSKFHSEQRTEEPGQPKTKVVKETHTLPDGTVVTKTKYETTMGSSSTSTSKSSFSTQQRSHYDEAKTIKYQSEPQVVEYYQEPVTRSSKTQEITSNTENVNASNTSKISTSSTHQKTNITSDIDNYKTIQDSKMTTIPQTPETDIMPQSTNKETTSQSSLVHKTSSNTSKSYSKTSQHHSEDLKTTRQEHTPRTIEYTLELVPQSQNETSTTKSTTVTKDSNQNLTHNVYQQHTDDSKTIRQETVPHTLRTTTVTKEVHHEELPSTTISTKTDDSVIKNTEIKHISNKSDLNQQFIRTEQYREQKTRPQEGKETPTYPVPSPERPIVQQSKQPKESMPEQQKPKQESPERRQPIKPPKSELDEKSQPTTGQYDTTYRTDYTNKKISVDLSATHQAFASSLRSVSPDRVSTRTSHSSLRSSVSPEKSPKKTTSTETITYRSDSLKRRTENKKITKNTEFDSSTITKKKSKSRSRSPSPTTPTNDILYRRIVTTDLDVDERNVNRPSSLEITKKTRKITDRSPTSPLGSPKKSPVKDRSGSFREDRTYKRTDTYEERCKQILGITDTEDKRRNSIEKIKKKGYVTKDDKAKTPIKDTRSPTKELKSPSKVRETLLKKDTTETDYSKTTQTKKIVNKAISETRKSPQRNEYPENKKQMVSEFPSQVRKSPEKEPLSDYPEKKRLSNEAPLISEFPSQIRKSPEKEPLPDYPEKKKPTSKTPSINEFPSQIRKSPEKEPLPDYPEKKKPTSKTPSINEFPSQIRKSPEKEPLPDYPEKKKPTSKTPSINEFPSQIRKSPEKEPLPDYPEKKRPTSEAPLIKEFPSQIRKSPEKEPLPDYPEKKKPTSKTPSINEFPSQIRKSPEKEPLPDYPEKKKPTSKTPSINEFPSQIRKSPEKEPLPDYPEKKRPTSEAPLISEFPSQIRKSPEKDVLTKISTDDKRNINEQFIAVEKVQEENIRLNKVFDKKTSEFLPEIRKSPEKEPLPIYPKKTDTIGKVPTVCEFPSQVRKSPEKEPLPDYPEKQKPFSNGPSIKEFPSQIRKSPEKKPLPEYPEKKKSSSHVPSINEFPSQIRKSLEKEPLPDYPEKKKPTSKAPNIKEFPSQTRKVPEKKPLESKAKPTKALQKKEPVVEYPDKKKPIKEQSRVNGIPLQNRKVPDHKAPENIRPVTQTPQKLSPMKKIPDKKFTPIRPTSPLKKPSSKTGIHTSSSEENIEEIMSTTKVTNVTQKIPVEEPLATKKFINQMCREEEIQKNNKKQTLIDLENEIIETSPKKPNKTVKKDLSAKKINQTFIDKETNEKKTPVKKYLVEKNIITQTKEINKVPSRTTVKENSENRMKNQKFEDHKKTKIEETRKKTLTKVDVTSPKRHTVTTTINVTPKKTTVTTTRVKTLQNGHVSSDSEFESNRKSTVSNEIHKKLSKIEPRSKKPEKCITTKSIIINNNDNTHRQIVVELQRSKSSREPTPDRVCPHPVTEDEGTPRFPDIIDEPDDHKRPKPKKISDIPIIESETIDEFNRITEVDEKVTDTSSKTVEIQEEEDDESLLSVSEKVNKFITTAEQLTHVDRPKSPRCKFYDEDKVKVSEKVAHFITEAEKIIQPSNTKSLKTDVDLEDSVSVSNKVKHFTSKPKTDEPVSLSKLEIKASTECVQIEKEDQMYSRTPTRAKSPEKAVPSSTERSPSPSKLFESSTKTTEHTKIRSQSPEKPADTARNSSKDFTRRTPTRESPSRESPSRKSPEKTRVKEDSKPILSETIRLRNTESIKKAKALFENGDKPKQHNISSRPTVFEARKKPENKEIPEIVTPCSRESSPGGVPGYMKPLDRSLRPKSPHRESITELKKIEDEKKTTKFGVTLRRTSSTRHTNDKKMTTITITEEEIEKIWDLEVLEELLIKVIDYELRRKIRAQIRLVKKTTEENSTEYQSEFTKKSSISTKTVDNKLYHHSDLTSKDTVDSKTEYQRSFKSPSPDRIIPKKTSNKIFQHTDVITNKQKTDSKTEYQHSYKASSPERFYSRRISDTRTEQRKSKSPEIPTDSTSVTRSSTYENTTTNRKNHERSPVRKDYFAESTKLMNERNIDKSGTTTTKTTSESRTSKDSKITKTVTTEKRCSPERTTTTTTKVFQTQLRKINPQTKAVVDDKPEWVKQKILKKPSEKVPAPTFKRTQPKSPSPIRDKVTDVITSSYGVGPTDENGTPLFGLKALRTKNTKVQGTVISSEYYSENGKEPIGNITVTKYSTDPKDLGVGDNVTSVTTTQKFGYKDSPSLSSLTTSKTTSTTTKEEKSSKVTRKNSVKALSQKFIDNAVETSKTERHSPSYPKAGLILRSRESDSSRETSPTMKETKTFKEVKTESFLSNKSKVTGVQDVINRMKTEEVQEGDSAKDIEARGLLNKFLGSQVILSGLEASVKKMESKSTTRITTTEMENGKQVTKTRIFQHPITEEDLQSVWDEETLRLLLEESTDYEERRFIRTKLRQIMAEQEACTELDKATEEESSSSTTTTTTTATTQQQGKIEGESLLLPLLQGLLDAPDNETTPDSGTESGEDQRSGLIAEVQNALDKLAANLRSDATDVTPERRSSLLQLVTKLQAGLAATSSINNSERRGSCQNRFNRRRQRPNRHTVGVSSEELADARRLIEEISLTPPESKISLLPKQSSDGSINSYKQPLVKNTTPKPFSSSNSTTSSIVQTPTDALEFLFQEEQPHDTNLKMVAQSVQAAAANKIIETKEFKTEEKNNDDNDETEEEEEEEEDVEEEEVEEEEDEEEEEQQEQQDIEEEDEEEETIKDSQPDIIQTHQYTPHKEKLNRFNSKKLKMKRANTIDIPKPLHFYHDDEDSDTSLPDHDFNHRRRSNYLALRGPIRVGIPPAFEPKTENDKKFLAFINKQNENNANKNPLWVKERDSLWTNRFGNIKTTFEQGKDNLSASKFEPKINRRNINNIQQIFEQKQQTEKKLPWTQQPKQIQLPKQQPEQETVKRNLKLNTNVIPQPLPINKFSHAPQSAFKPLPKKSQPESPQTPQTPPATEIIKSKIKTNKPEPEFLYCPKPIEVPQTISIVNKPSWGSGSSGGRVLSLAASKFESQTQPPSQPQKLQSPYLVKNAEKSSVRKLSDQWECTTYPSIKQQPPARPHNYVPNAYQPNLYQNKTTETNPFQSKPQLITKKTLPTNTDSSQFVSTYKLQIQNNKPVSQKISQVKSRFESQIKTTNDSYNKPQLQKQSSYENKANQFQSKINYQRQPSLNDYQSSQQYQSRNYNQHTKPVNDVKSSNIQQNNHDHRKSIDEKLQDYKSHVQLKHKNDFVETPKQKYGYHSSIQQQSNYKLEEPKIVKQEPKSNPYQSTTQYHDQKSSIQDIKYQELKSPKKDLPQEGQPLVVYNRVSYDRKEERPKYETQSSTESVREYTAVSSKVMTGPVCQTATTVRQKSPMSRDEHDMTQAFNLKNSLLKNNINGSTSPRTDDESKRIENNREMFERSIKQQQSQPPQIKKSSSPRSFSFKSPTPRDEGVVTAKFQIPVINVSPDTPKLPSPIQIMHKAEAWNQICMQNQQLQHKPSPRSSPNHPVLKSKSSHTLAVPSGQFQAGMSKEEIEAKKRAMEAFMNPLSRTPSNENVKVVKRSINRVKTTEKVSTFRHSSGLALARSRTLPDIVCPDMLDESNVDKAFEDLFKASS